eukprot:73572-Pleurochrysis_carterae.AAC.1
MHSLIAAWGCGSAACSRWQRLARPPLHASLRIVHSTAGDACLYWPSQKRNERVAICWVSGVLGSVVAARSIERCLRADYGRDTSRKGDDLWRGAANNSAADSCADLQIRGSSRSGDSR